MAKNLKALTSKFPAFGVLFETISEARMDLLYFSVMSLAIALAFAVVAYSLFGPHSEVFSTMNGASLSLLKMAFGRDYFKDFDESNSDISIPFFVIYSFIFYFVILNVYAAIVMRTYDNLRQKKQLLTEAMADIVTQ